MKRSDKRAAIRIDAPSPLVGEGKYRAIVPAGGDGMAKFARPIPRDGACAPPRDEVVVSGARSTPHGEEPRPSRGVSNHEAFVRSEPAARGESFTPLVPA